MTKKRVKRMYHIFSVLKYKKETSTKMYIRGLSGKFADTANKSSI